MPKDHYDLDAEPRGNPNQPPAHKQAEHKPGARAEVKRMLIEQAKVEQAKDDDVS